MATRWLRWNTTSHIFEYSTDGVTFNVLPLNASILNEGTLSDARLSANVPLIDAANAFSAINRLTNVAPVLQYNETDQGAGLKNWDWGVDGGVFALRQLDDAYATPVNLLTLTRNGALFTPNRIDVGGSLQSDSLFRGRKGGNNFEFGHPNASGFISSLGAGSGSGKPHIAFSAEHGTNSNTFLTRGNPGSVMQGDLTGGFLWGKVPTASADNQALTTLMTLTNAGVLNLALDGIIERGRAFKLGEWTTFTPTWTSTGTAPSFGNASLNCRYTLIGKTCIACFFISFGSTTTFGTGTYSFTLPVSNDGAMFTTGAGYVFDTSAGTYFAALPQVATSTTINIPMHGFGLMSNAIPVTLATGDLLRITIAFPTAS